MAWFTAIKTFFSGLGWMGKLSSLFSYWGLFKVALFAAPFLYAYVTKLQASSDASDLKLVEIKNEQLTKAIQVTTKALSDERDALALLEDSLERLTKSRQVAIDERNEAWRRNGLLEDEKDKYLKRNDLTPMELEYAKCQPIPVPDIRRPNQ